MYLSYLGHQGQPKTGRTKAQGETPGLCYNRIQGRALAHLSPATIWIFTTEIAASPTKRHSPKSELSTIKQQHNFHGVIIYFFIFSLIFSQIHTSLSLQATKYQYIIIVSHIFSLALNLQVNLHYLKIFNRLSFDFSIDPINFHY
jgi:hypothetical protein